MITNWKPPPKWRNVTIVSVFLLHCLGWLFFFGLIVYAFMPPLP